MDTVMKADIFFFITSIAVVFLSIFVIIALYYLIRALKRFSKLSETLEDNIGDASEDIKEMTEQVKESFVFNMIFPKKRKRRTSKE